MWWFEKKLSFKNITYINPKLLKHQLLHLFIYCKLRKPSDKYKRSFPCNFVCTFFALDLKRTTAAKCLFCLSNSQIDNSRARTMFKAIIEQEQRFKPLQIPFHSATFALWLLLWCGSALFLRRNLLFAYWSIVMNILNLCGDQPQTSLEGCIVCSRVGWF